MPAQLVKYVQRSLPWAAPRAAVMVGKSPDALHKIFQILRSQTGHDFSFYKKNTICRRIERRMNVHQIEDASTYLRFLQQNPQEVGTLFNELLIGVTNFSAIVRRSTPLAANGSPNCSRANPRNIPCACGSPAAPR